MSWVRRASFIVCVAQLPFAAAPRAEEQEFMTGPVVANSPTNLNPARGALNLIGDVGVSVVDTLAQTTRFTSNIFTLDIEGAFMNLGQVFSKRSIDSILVQFVENLPAVLEKDLHKQYKPSADVAVGQYFTDSKLDAKETAALLNYVLKANGRSPADAKRLVAELKETAATMQKGGNKSAAKLGQEMGQSMRLAMAAAPKPLPIIGSPLNEKRRLAISKGFLHSVVQTQGVPYARGNITVALEKGKAAGLEVTGLSDSMIRSTMDNAVENLGLRKCLELAKNNDELMACANTVSSNKNKITGSALETLGPQLANGKLKITLDNPQIGSKIDLGKHLAGAISANASEVKKLEATGNNESLNKVVNHAAQSITKDVGGKVVDSKLAPAFANTADGEKRVKAWGQTVVDRFAGRLKLLQGGDALVAQVQGLLGGGAANAADNKLLDGRIRGPFTATLADPEAKAALLGIFLEKTPLSSELRSELHKTYAAAIKKKPFVLPATLPEGLRGFLQSFEASLDKVAQVPESLTTIGYLKDLMNPNSTSLNKIVADFGPGASGLVSFYVDCKPSDKHCDSLQAPFKDYIQVLRDAKSGLKGKSFASTCSDSGPQLVSELFAGVRQMDVNVKQAPHDAILALASERSQESVDCLLSGLAAAKGFPNAEVERLHEVLAESRVKRPGDRQELVASLHGYLGSPEAGGPAQTDLLAKTEAISKDLVRDYARGHVEDFAARGSNKMSKVMAQPGNVALAQGVADRLIDNTDLIDENTSLPLKDYAKAIAESPLKANTPIDKSIQAGLDKTLAEPETRRDLLGITLGIDDTLLSKRAGGVIGPGLERRIKDAYAGADLTGETPKFQSSVSPGVQSFLRGFDSSTRNLASHRGEDQSALKFLADFAKPESRLVDKLIAEQSGGVRDLIMSLISCKSASQNELCAGCQGDKGNWILMDRKTGTSEVLANAPMGQVLALLKVGLRSSMSDSMNKTCQAAIPATIERIVAQPKSNPGALSVLQDPGLFLDALARSENQTALNCIVANFAETKVLSQIRSKHVGTEAGLRSILSYIGVPENVALFELSGERLFETFEKRNANPTILKRKSDLVAALKTTLKTDTSKNRHATAIALQDLSRTMIVSTISDADMAYGLANGSQFPSALRAWADSSNNTLARATIMCMDRHYQGGLMPAALYAGEDASRLITRALDPWIRAGEGGRRLAVGNEDQGALVGSEINPPAGAASAGPAPASAAAAEACVDTVAAAAGGAIIGPKATAPTSTTLTKTLWVGGYDHTLRDFQEVSRSQGSAYLSKSGEAQVLGHTKNYQALLNHIRMRDDIVGKGSGVTDKLGDALFEVQSAGAPGKDAAMHLKKVLNFPAAKLVAALQAYKDSGSNQNAEAVRQILYNNCSDIWSQWAQDPKHKKLSEPDKASH
jgi:hypothetical protein